MSGATNKVSLIEKVVALLAPLNEHVETLPELEAARKCASLAPKLSTVMGSIARADSPPVMQHT